MKKLATFLSVIAASAVLVACGGGGGGGDAAPLVASSNVTAPVTAGSSTAVVGQAFAFNSGVTSFGTASPTTVTLNSTSSFNVSSSEGTASGNLSYGSCIFTVTNSTYPSTSPLATGKTVTVQPCSITVTTAGLAATEGAVARAVSFVLADNASQAASLQVDVTESGAVIVNGTTVGTVTLSTTTGASGG